MRRNWFHAVLFAGALVAMPASAGPIEKLHAFIEQTRSAKATFSQEVTDSNGSVQQKASGTVQFQRPGKFRWTYDKPYEQVIVGDGEKLWIYYPNFKEAELYTLGQRQVFDDSIAALTAGLNFDRVQDFYRVRAFREGAGHRIVLAPKSTGLKRMVKELAVWVDDEFKIEKTEATLPKEDRVVTTYRNQKPAPIPAGTFDFTPPADAHISQPLGK